MSTDVVERRRARVRIVVNLLFAAAILIPSLWGFSMKFREFVLLARGEVDGVFAVTPVVNYLLASIGFLLLFGWAAANGMFHDIEQPKRTMLENELRLDELERLAVDKKHTVRNAT